jgi:GrpB-like predicted nucleotidyltransferase (UPF0157 family)
MLGLKRHTVRVVPHDPNWFLAFGAEREYLLKAGGDLIQALEHVGSTSIPELPAKPILDIAIAVATRDHFAPLIERLERLPGYIYRGDSGADGGHLMVKESEPDVRTVHVHMVEQSDAQWVNYLDFREALKQNAAYRHQYLECKKELMAENDRDRKRYTIGKRDIIQAILRDYRLNRLEPH